MKGATTSDNIIIPKAQGYLQVSTIQDGKCIDVLCYYSPEFTSMLLLDNNVLKSDKHVKEYSGQSMLEWDKENKESEIGWSDRTMITILETASLLLHTEEIEQKYLYFWNHQSWVMLHNVSCYSFCPWSIWSYCQDI